MVCLPHYTFPDFNENYYNMLGQKLNNRYEIQNHLGDGSTATVYKAFDLRLERHVALKVLLPHVKESTRKRFFQEATAAAHLNHPNIMSIHDIGEDRNRHYLIVEYVEGDTLSHYIPAKTSDLVDIGLQIANALQYAHEQEIIHRDIKPANIKVTPEGMVKIMDLGLALPREGKRVTADGMVIGTPAYLSPEQAQGHALDARTDIYSLGIVLFEMATGQLPFNADDITALLLQQVKQEPPSPRLINPDLPTVIENIILKALEKDPNRRFQSCHALASALEAGGTGQLTVEAATSQQHALDNNDHREYRKNYSKTIRIILADDHNLFRRTLASLLESQDQFVVLAEAHDGESALRQTVALLPDVLLLDLNMPGITGLEVLPQIREKAPKVKVLVLTGRSEDAYIVRALRAGAHGYLLKSTDEDELVLAIQKVLQDELVLGTGITERVVTGLLHNRTELTDEEVQISLYIAAGYSNEEIASHLGFSNAHLIEVIAQLINKLNAQDRNTAALKALREGHISLEDIQNLANKS